MCRNRAIVGAADSASGGGRFPVDGNRIGRESINRFGCAVFAG